MTYHVRALDLIKSITTIEDEVRSTRIIDSFFSARNDLTNRLEFVADRANPTEEEKAHVFIEAFREFGEITVSGQARLTKEEELKSQFVDAENSAKADFSEII